MLFQNDPPFTKNDVPIPPGVIFFKLPGGDGLGIMEIIMKNLDIKSDPIKQLSTAIIYTTYANKELKCIV